MSKFRLALQAASAQAMSTIKDEKSSCMTTSGLSKGGFAATGTRKAEPVRMPRRGSTETCTKRSKISPTLAKYFPPHWSSNQALACHVLRFVWFCSECHATVGCTMKLRRRCLY